MYPHVIFNESHFGREWFEAESSRVANGLLATGLRPGDAVGAMLRNCPEYVVLILACRRAGLYLVSINWHFKALEAHHILSDSGSRLLVVQEDLLPQIAAGVPAATVIVTVPMDKTFGSSDISSAPSSKKPTRWESLGFGMPLASMDHGFSGGAIAYTSGTTGKPKGVKKLARASEEQSTHDAELLQIHRQVFGIHPESVCYLSAPIYHSAPMSYVVNTCLSGATLVLEASFKAAHALDLLTRYKVTSAYIVPTMMQRLLNLDDDTKHRFDTAWIRHVICTGSPCPPEFKRRMVEWWGPVIYEAYASSETGYITLIDSAESLARPKSVGKPVGHARVRIFADDGTEASAGVVGQIYARQPASPDFTYVNNEDARLAMEKSGLISVGDVGYLDDAGYLFISDRKSDMVISGGVNIYPAEVEAQLLTLSGVADCAVFGIPDDEYGEALAAVVQPELGSDLNDLQVRAHLQACLANFKVPRVIEFHAELPREDSGKIFKRLLREPYWRDRERSV